MKRNRWYWLLDAALLCGYVVSFQLDWTGLPVHEWLGLGVGLLAVCHLILHWQWVRGVAVGFFQRRTSRPQLYFIMNTCLLIGFICILLTGLVISTWFALPLKAYQAWRQAHIVVSVFALLLLAVKLMAHWRWITAVGHKMIPVPIHRAMGSDAGASTRTRHALERRDFIKVAGVVSGAYILAIAGVVRNDVRTRRDPGGDSSTRDEPDPAELPEPHKEAPSSWVDEVSTPSEVDETGTEADCVVRCRRGCTFPGECRHYVDDDGNGRCDFGECR
ncbi:MAG: ferric reductase-like transmembrane domain-containing protein [Anaerolineales bacterium]|nr:ferric reductase-like transmembrane domain-containing protein [Anaerolineales bacterium]